MPLSLVPSPPLFPSMKRKADMKCTTLRCSPSVKGDLNVRDSFSVFLQLRASIRYMALPCYPRIPANLRDMALFCVPSVRHRFLYLQPSFSHQQPIKQPLCTSSPSKAANTSSRAIFPSRQQVAPAGSKQPKLLPSRLRHTSSFSKAANPFPEETAGKQPSPGQEKNLGSELRDPNRMQVP